MICPMRDKECIEERCRWWDLITEECCVAVLAYNLVPGMESEYRKKLV